MNKIKKKFLPKREKKTAFYLFVREFKYIPISEEKGVPQQQQRPQQHRLPRVRVSKVARETEGWQDDDARQPETRVLSSSEALSTVPPRRWCRRL